MQKSSIIPHIKTLARGVNIITNSEISTILRSAAELIAFCRYHVLFDSTKPQTPNGRRYCHAYCHCTLHIFTKSSATIFPMIFPQFAWEIIQYHMDRCSYSGSIHCCYTGPCKLAPDRAILQILSHSHVLHTSPVVQLLI